MTEIPLQFTISHQFFSDIIISSGTDILNVFDNMIIQDIEITVPDESNHEQQVLRLTQIQIQSATEINNKIVEDFSVQYDYDVAQNQITMGIPKLENQPFLKGTAFIEKIDQDGNPISQGESIIIFIEIQSASITFDYQFYKPMPQKQIEYLQSFNMNLKSNQQLAIQIVKNSVQLQGFEYKFLKEENDFIQNQNYFQEILQQHVYKGIEESISQRIALINDPKEILESLNFKYQSIQMVEEMMLGIIDKLGFKFPQKLIAPVTFFAILNTFASKIQVQDKHTLFQFDPRGYGIISEKILNVLSEISHPKDLINDDIAYSMTLDQNIINSAINEYSEIKQEVKLRKLLSIIDKKGQYIKLLNTQLFQLNMPMIIKDYGSRQFDVVTTLNQQNFWQKNKQALISGFDINENGQIKATLNLESFIKIGPQNLIDPNSHFNENNEDSDFESKSDEEIEIEKKQIFQNFVDSESWTIARTVYTTLTLNGRILIRKDENLDQSSSSTLIAEINGFDISKLDFYIGDHSNSQPNDNQSYKDQTDEDDDEDDDDDDNDKSKKTQEGGLIQALVNIQLKSYLKQFLPKFQHQFSNDIQKVDVFDCYGIHFRIPQMKIFKGGFMIQGDYKKVPILKAACQEINTDFVGFISNLVAPKMLKQKFEILLQLYQKINPQNPDIAGVIKDFFQNNKGIGSDMFKNELLGGITDKINTRKASHHLNEGIKYLKDSDPSTLFNIFDHGYKLLDPDYRNQKLNELIKKENINIDDIKHQFPDNVLSHVHDEL